MAETLRGLLHWGLKGEPGHVAIKDLTVVSTSLFAAADTLLADLLRLMGLRCNWTSIWLVSGRLDHQLAPLTWVGSALPFACDDIDAPQLTQARPDGRHFEVVLSLKTLILDQSVRFAISGGGPESPVVIAFQRRDAKAPSVSSAGKLKAFGCGLEDPGAW